MLVAHYVIITLVEAVGKKCKRDKEGGFETSLIFNGNFPFSSSSETRGCGRRGGNAGVITMSVSGQH